MNKIFILIYLFLCVIGFVAGIGYLVYYGEYVPAVGVVLVGILAYPRFVKLLKEFVK